MPDCHRSDPDLLCSNGRSLVAVVGNPNVGKSTLFNALTGGQHAVGNWAGRTVRSGAASCVLGDADFDVVDLPGAYSLAASSPEELVTRDAVLGRRGALDAVALVLDAGNLERTLVLAAEVLDTGLPAVLVVTMLDIAATRGMTVDLAGLGVALGRPVVAVDPRSGRGLSELTSELGAACRGRAAAATAVAGPASFATAQPAVQVSA